MNIQSRFLFVSDNVSELSNKNKKHKAKYQNNQTLSLPLFRSETKIEVHCIINKKEENMEIKTNSLSFIEENDLNQSIKNKFYFNSVGLKNDNKTMINVEKNVEKKLINFLNGNNFVLVQIGDKMIDFLTTVQFILNINCKLDEKQKNEFYTSDQRYLEEIENYYPNFEIVYKKDGKSCFYYIFLQEKHEIMEFAKIIQETKNNYEVINSSYVKFKDINKIIEKNCSTVININMIEQYILKGFCLKAKTSFIQDNTYISDFEKILNKKQFSSNKSNVFIIKNDLPVENKAIINLIQNDKAHKQFKVEKYAEISHLQDKITEVKNKTNDLKDKLAKDQKEIKEIEKFNKKTEYESKILEKKNQELRENIKTVVDRTGQIKSKEAQIIQKLYREFDYEYREEKKFIKNINPKKIKVQGEKNLLLLKNKENNPNILNLSNSN